jgi:putative FmdB family regulatory protein
MPTYMYKCRDCGHRFEEVQGFHDDPVQICPDCRGQVQRVIGNVGVTFKGSGFYRTDSRSAKKSTAGSTPKKAESTGSSDTKSPATKDSSTTKSTGGSSTTT